MGAEEKIILINDLINSLEEIKNDEGLLKDFQIYSEVHGVNIIDRQNEIVETRKIYKNVEIVLPIDGQDVLKNYPIGTAIEPF